MSRQFPIHSDSRRQSPPPHSVPWEWLAQFEQQARANHDQTLERLAQRGGLAWCEMLAVIRGEGLREAFAYCRGMADGEAQRLVLAELAKWEAPR